MKKNFDELDINEKDTDCQEVETTTIYNKNDCTNQVRPSYEWYEEQLKNANEENKVLKDMIKMLIAKYNYLG